MLGQDPSIDIIKSGSFNDENGDTYGQEGETVTYTYDVENDGNVTLTALDVSDEFETAGLVERHNFDGGHAVFELASGEHHDHMVCMDSGDVIEFHDDAIEQRQRQICEDRGYELVDHSLVLYVRPKK